MLVVHVAVLLLFVLLGILFRTGRGAFLIAGYNTAPSRERTKYDEKKLCRFMGRFLFVLAGCWGICALSELFRLTALLWLGFALFLVAVIAGVIYANTGNRFKK